MTEAICFSIGFAMCGALSLLLLFTASQQLQLRTLQLALVRSDLANLQRRCRVRLEQLEANQEKP